MFFKNVKIDKRFFSFILIGIINTIFGYSVYAFLLWVGLHFSLAAGLSTILGILFNFKSIGVFVFNSKDNSKIKIFLIIYFICYVVNLVGIYSLEFFDVNSFFGGAVMLIPTALLTYNLLKRYVYNHA
jgi:putative flippase GtrA